MKDTRTKILRFLTNLTIAIKYNNDLLKLLEAGRNRNTQLLKMVDGLTESLKTKDATIQAQANEIERLRHELVKSKEILRYHSQMYLNNPRTGIVN